MRWIIRPLPEATPVNALAAQLSRERKFPLPLANILVQRKVLDFEAARRYFKPVTDELHDPFQLADMSQAVERLIRAHQEESLIWIYGDYDVDGTTSVALMTLGLESLGFNTAYYIPDRYAEGYGLSYKGVDAAAAAGADLIITLDCGIKAHDKVRYASQKGIDVIICDHHTPADSLPPAYAVLDPKRADCTYPYKELTGCGVGAKLLTGLTYKMREKGFSLPSKDWNPIYAFADLLALSIACDIVPITGENRVMAHMGLEKLRQDPLPGIAAIMAQADRPRDWHISDLVFFVGPRINAAGRLSHAKEAVEVLLGKGELIKQAMQLQHTNESRKAQEQLITEGAIAHIAADPGFEVKHTTVLYDPSWHKGIIGIVASRLIETWYRPTVLLTDAGDGTLVGSARSVAGFDLYDALMACDEYLIQWGGHKHAAGLRMKTEAFPAFAKAFEAVVATRIKPDQQEPCLFIDLPVKLGDIDDRLIRIINRMEPFGPSNRRPVFLTEGVKVRHQRVMKEKHLKLVLEQDGLLLEAIGFGLAEKWGKIGQEWLDIAFQPVFNTWNDKTTVNLRLKDFRPAHEGLS
ncbi:MAG: single-stranded-DNA-specific exonuclease RecJ [Bacteroidota bacterium]